jgi:GT2 family glycosyltransferase
MVAGNQQHPGPERPASRAVTSARRLADRLLGRRGDPSEADDAQRPQTRVDRLLDSGIFDLEYYTAVSGREFESERHAARHCINVGMPHGRSPHPLLDIYSVPRTVRTAWRRGQIGKLVDHLESEAGWGASSGPLFYPPALDDARIGPDRPGCAIAQFEAVVEEQALLPVPPGYWGPAPTLAQARAALIAQARSVASALHEDVRTNVHAQQPAMSALRQEIDTYIQTGAVSPRVSIVCGPPISPRQFIEMLDRLRQQTLTDWELLISSGDWDPELHRVVEVATTREARLKIVETCPGTDHDGSCAALWNATGEYLAFLSPRTSWDDDFLRAMVSTLDRRGIAAGQAFVANEWDGETRLHSFGETHDRLVFSTDVDLGGAMVRRDALVQDTGPVQHVCGALSDSRHAHQFALRFAHRDVWPLFPLVAGHRGRPEPVESHLWVGLDVVQEHLLRCHASRAASTVARVPGRVSVVIPSYDEFRLTIAAVSATLRTTSTNDVEVVIIDNGSKPDVGERLVAAFLSEPRVRYHRLARNLGFGLACNAGHAVSTGEFVLFLNNDTIPRGDWLDAMLPLLDDSRVRGVQPLLLYADDTIQSAGLYFPAKDTLPCHFLVGHPPEDARRAGERGFSAVSGAALLMRAAEFEALGGFDVEYVNGMEDADLCLRALDTFGGRFQVAPTAKVTHLEGRTPGRSDHVLANRAAFMRRWRSRLPQPDTDRLTDIGFRLAHIGADDVAIPVPRPVLTRDGGGRLLSPPDRLRWGIKLPSIPGPSGDHWGDTHLARSLANALRELDQDVVTYRRGTHQSNASYLDDVVLGIRGLERIHPQAGKINVLWVISHPDDVTVDELQSFDLVFAASESWSRQMTARSGRPVRVLRQAVDARQLPSADVPTGDGSRPVFVGGKYGDRRRQVVFDAMQAGIDFEVHGPGWEGLIPAPVLRSSYVPNHEVTSVYRSRGLVLADHWDDMAREGFIANRIFDAVAAGARVISDYVPGIQESFSGAVQVYRSVDELGYLCSPDGRERFPEPETLAQIALRVRNEESFLSRARVLVDAVRRTL